MLNKKALSGSVSAGPPVFVEDVFSTYLWDGNSTARNIVNGIDLAGKGGLVWTKYRNAENHHRLYDTARGATKEIYTSLTNAEATSAQSLTAFNSNGFSLGTGQPNETTATVVGWTFRKQAKFFDVVTYTGNGSGSGQTINHNLGSVPGSIIVKRTDTTGNWAVYHRSLTSANYSLLLNLTGAEDLTDYFLSTPTSTTFQVGSNSVVNASGGTYVAYLFAHNAGGFGTAGTDNVISCGSYTGNGSDDGPTVTLGYEPQWMLVKRSSSTGGWRLIDNMRGNSLTSQAVLSANSSSAESTTAEGRLAFTATGFKLIYGFDSDLNSNGSTYVYIAIRRGPMKTPTSGTSVYNAAFGSSTTVGYTAGFPVDLAMTRDKVTTSFTWATSRLTGQMEVYTNSTLAESDGGTNTRFDFMTGWHFPNQTADRISWMFKRAPGFFDVVCYDGLRAINNTTPQAVSHNLGVAPELVIVKCRSSATVSSTATNWSVCTILNGTYSNGGFLNTNDSFGFSNNLNPADGGGVSTSNITFGYGDARTNASGQTYVAYLFATLAGVSKVGSYTGNGSSQTINCGFTAGARFVMIKRTNSTGDWYVWDTARGIVSGNDPYLLLNDTAAEVTNTDYIDPVNSGFELSSTAPAAINANGGSFIFFAVS